MKKENYEITKEQIARLKALESLPDDQIDTTDIPEIPIPKNAKRGSFYRPAKEEVTLQLDRYIVTWFKLQTEDGSGYESVINDALHEYIRQRMKRISE